MGKKLSGNWRSRLEPDDGFPNRAAYEDDNAPDMGEQGEDMNARVYKNQAENKEIARRAASAKKTTPPSPTDDEWRRRE